MDETAQPFPELAQLEWVNSEPIRIAEQRGKVVLVYAFQMLCPGCVVSAGPQIKRVHALFSRSVMTVIGLHTVFEHHEAMQIPSLKAFLHEFRYDFPVAVDRHIGGNPIPETMAALGLQGTPSILLVDKLGRLRRHFFGTQDDLYLGAEIGHLLSERYENL
jgi:hypothetical protein